MSGYTAEVYPGKDGWRFRVKAGNGEIMCTGEAYVRRIDAESALKQLFGNGRTTMEVTVRNHGTDIVDHYMLGKGPNGCVCGNPNSPGVHRSDGPCFEPTLDEAYTGPMEDTTSAFRSEEPDE